MNLSNNGPTECTSCTQSNSVTQFATIEPTRHSLCPFFSVNLALFVGPFIHLVPFEMNFVIFSPERTSISTVVHTKVVCIRVNAMYIKSKEREREREKRKVTGDPSKCTPYSRSFN